MRTPLAGLVMLALTVGAHTAGVLTTDTLEAAPESACAPPRRALLPGGVERVTRERYVAPCLGERSVPVYEITQEPIYGCRMVPRYGAVHVPVVSTRQEAVYETRRTPVCVQATVPIYAMRCTPVMGLDLLSWGEERRKPWFSITERVQCGVRTEPRVVGFKEEKIQVGTVSVACDAGVRIEKRFLGYEQEQFVVGTREVRRIVAWRKEAVVIQPARVETVAETFQRPGRWVTVSDAPGGVPLMAGTTEIMTEAQFAAATRAIAASSAAATTR